MASQAVSQLGLPQSWIGPLQRIAEHESSGDPSAVNNTPVGSEHATGLMQTLPSTFREYMLPGHTDINNPVDNMIAAIRYIQSRYGDPNVALQKSLAGGY